jgi:hypothetical protein
MEADRQKRIDYFVFDSKPEGEVHKILKLKNDELWMQSDIYLYHLIPQ